MGFLKDLFALAVVIAAAYLTQGQSLWIQSATMFATSLVVSRVFGEKPPKMQDNGVRQQVPPATVNSLPVVYGDAYLGGTFIDACLTTTQKQMYYVLAISSISPNGQFSFDTTKMYYGDRLITFDGTDQTRVVSLTDGDGNVDTKINTNLNISLYTSDSSGNITNINGQDPWSTSTNSMGSNSGLPSNLQWTSTNRKMYNLAFAIVRLNYSTDAGTTQLSPITFKVSHYLNGAGAAKPGDVWYDYITNTEYGGAVDSALVDSSSVTALNSYSDELITFTDNQGDPATQPRYRINGVFDTGTNVLENIDKLLECCDSWMTYSSVLGKWAIVVNKAETASLYFDDTNIIGDIKVSTLDINQSVNQIEAKFPSKLNKDIPDYVYLETPAALLYPNEPVNKYTTEFSMTNDSVQAQYLANRILEQAREDLIVTINTTYYGIQANAGDVVAVTNDVYGWDQKLFRVYKVQEASLPDGGLGASIDLTEYNAEVYDDKPITEFTPAPNSYLPSPSYFSALSAPVVSASSPTASVPSFDVTVTSPATGRVTYAILYYTVTATPSETDYYQLAMASTAGGLTYPNSTDYIFAAQSLPAGTYYFAFKVGNETNSSNISSLSSAFVWAPVGQPGPTGPAGPTGPLGPTGEIGPRSSTGYVYYENSSGSAPSTPTLSGYNFTTGAFTSISANWTTTFNAPTPDTDPSSEEGSKFWAARYSVSEATYGGVQTITVSSPFNWQNFDGLVTFTNVTTNSGTTFIDGGNIITNTITADKMDVNDLSAINANLGTVTAGDLHANVFWIGDGNGYTSCIYKDNESGLQLYSTANSTWFGTYVNGATIHTDTSWMICGPDYHSSVNIQNRCRNTDNNLDLPLFVSFTGKVDHYCSLWFRYWINGTPQSWNFLITVIENSASQGGITITYGSLAGVGNNAAIQMGVSPTNSALVPFNAGQVAIENFVANIQCVNT